MVELLFHDSCFAESNGLSRLIIMCLESPSGERGESDTFIEEQHVIDTATCEERRQGICQDAKQQRISVYVVVASRRYLHYARMLYVCMRRHSDRVEGPLKISTSIESLRCISEDHLPKYVASA